MSESNQAKRAFKSVAKVLLVRVGFQIQGFYSCWGAGRLVSLSIIIERLRSTVFILNVWGRHNKHKF